MFRLYYVIWGRNPLLLIVFDLLCLAIGVRLAGSRRWRAAVVVFFALQIEVLVVTRSSFIHATGVPHWLTDAERIWHLGGAPLAIVACIAVLAWKAVTRGVGRPPANPSRRAFLRTSAAAAPILFTAGFDAVALGETRLRVRRATLTFPDLPVHLDGMRLAHVTDLHVGPYTSPTVLREMVEEVNAAAPDLVVVTGDWVNRELSDLPTALQLVRAFEAPFGVVGIEGNHDLLENPLRFHAMVRSAAIPLLLNQSVVIACRGGPLQLMGVRWGGATLSEDGREHTGTAAEVRRLAAARVRGVFPILLAHHPHAFDAAAAAGLPLTLSGHTHGGQVMLTPHLGIGPVVFQYWSGHYEKSGSQLFVSNGVGNFFPLRVQAPAEVVLLTLRRKPETEWV